MDEDTGLRFELADRLMRMHYGTGIVVPGELVFRAWPATGDLDRRPIAVFRAMALASAGHRPVQTLSTDERIRRDLDDSFQWLKDAKSGDYRFYRRVDACPHCQGQGFFDVHCEGQGFFDVATDYAQWNVAIINRKRIPCDHSPLPRP